MTNIMKMKLRKMKIKLIINEFHLILISKLLMKLNKLFFNI